MEFEMFEMDMEIIDGIIELLEKGENHIEIEYDEDKFLSGFNFNIKDSSEFIKEFKMNENIKGDIRLIDLDMNIFNDDILDLLKDKLSKFNIDFGYIGGRF